MRLKLDENLSESGAQVLRTAGHDVSTVAIQSLSGISDERLFAICKEEGRGLVTLDHDFGNVLRFPPRQGAGVAILELGPKPDLTAMLARLADLAAMLKVQSFEQALWIVEPGRVRMYLAGES